MLRGVLTKKKTGKKRQGKEKMSRVSVEQCKQTTGCLGDYTCIDLHSYMGIHDKPL